MSQALSTSHDSGARAKSDWSAAEVAAATPWRLVSSDYRMLHAALENALRACAPPSHAAHGDTPLGLLRSAGLSQPRSLPTCPISLSPPQHVPLWVRSTELWPMCQ